MNSILKDFAERALWTAGQQFFAVLLATSPVGGMVDLPWKFALSTAGGAMVVSLLTTALLYIPELKYSLGDSFWADLGTRGLKTFISSLLGTIGAVQLDVLELDWPSAFNIAVIATMSGIAKGFLAAGPGDAANPSTMDGEEYRSVYPSSSSSSKSSNQ